MTNLELQIKQIIAESDDIKLAPTTSNTELLADAIINSSMLKQFVKAASQRAEQVQPQGVAFKDALNADEQKIKSLIDKAHTFEELNDAFEENHVEITEDVITRTQDEALHSLETLHAVLSDELDVWTSDGDYVLNHETTFEGKEFHEDDVVSFDLAKQACLKHLREHRLAIIVPDDDDWF